MTQRKKAERKETPRKEPPRKEHTYKTHPDDHVCYEFFTQWFLVLEQIGAHIMSTNADLKTSIDTLTANVAKVAADVAALKNAPPAPPVVQNVEQADLDAAVTAIDAANTTLSTL